MRHPTRCHYPPNSFRSGGRLFSVRLLINTKSVRLLINKKALQISRQKSNAYNMNVSCIMLMYR